MYLLFPVLAMFTLALMIALTYILFLQADADGGALYLAGSATASLDSGSVTMANNAASDVVDIFVTSATLTCQTTCVANEVPSTPCTDAILPQGAVACPLSCGACEDCPTNTASTVVGSVDANDCVATTTVISGCIKPLVFPRFRERFAWAVLGVNADGSRDVRTLPLFMDFTERIVLHVAQKN